MANLLLEMNNSDDKEATAKKWVADNKELVDSWLK